MGYNKNERACCNMPSVVRSKRMAYIQSFRACLLCQKLRRLYFFCSFLNFNHAKIESLAFATAVMTTAAAPIIAMI